ncbi:MAG: hypothetical protein ACRESI_06465 [Gammaproteobacteria bacterium]
MIYAFDPNSNLSQTFNPVLDSATYTASIVWNIFSNRWFLNLTDQTGTLIIFCALASSNNQKQIASLVWADGVVTVYTQNYHFYPLGTIRSLRINGVTPAGYNGIYDCTVTGSNTFTFPLTTDPGTGTIFGTYGEVLDLTQGLFNASVLLYYAQGAYFETIP